MNTNKQIVSKMVEIANAMDFLNNQFKELSEMVSNIQPEMPSVIPSELLDAIATELVEENHNDIVADYRLEMDWQHKVEIDSLELDRTTIEQCIERAYGEYLTQFGIIYKQEDESQE